MAATIHLAFAFIESNPKEDLKNETVSFRKILRKATPFFLFLHVVFAGGGAVETNLDSTFLR